LSSSVSNSEWSAKRPALLQHSLLLKMIAAGWTFEGDGNIKDFACVSA
jgi:hypothetical protein